jgi:hypothetical protein
MINKHKEIIKLVNLVNKAFGELAPKPNRDWDNFSRIGLQKDNKRIYIAYYKKNDYFYECDLLVDDPDIVSISQENGNVSSKEELLNVIEKFFEIKRIG